jgi:hypothetical protein
MRPGPALRACGTTSAARRVLVSTAADAVTAVRAAAGEPVTAGKATTEEAEVEDGARMTAIAFTCRALADDAARRRRLAGPAAGRQAEHMVVMSLARVCRWLACVAGVTSVSARRRSVRGRSEAKSG